MMNMNAQTARAMVNEVKAEQRAKENKQAEDFITSLESKIETIASKGQNTLKVNIPSVLPKCVADKIRKGLTVEGFHISGRNSYKFTISW